MSTYDPEIHHRRSIRLKGYDYAQPGAYFITVVTQDRECLLKPGPVREMVQHWWDELPAKFATVQTDAFVVMPNHIHGIIMIVEEDAKGPTHRSAPEAPTEVGDVGADLGVRPDAADPTGPSPRSAPTLGTIIQWFKTMTTNAYIREVKQAGWRRFPGRFWQRNYYEHIVRSERVLNAIRQYIADNPARWALDRYNPDATGPDPQAASLWRLIQEDARLDPERSGSNTQESR